VAEILGHTDIKTRMIYLDRHKGRLADRMTAIAGWVPRRGFSPVISSSRRYRPERASSEMNHSQTHRQWMDTTPGLGF